MKLARNVFLGIAVIGVIGFLSSVAFAQEAKPAGKERYEAKIKVLQDSAAALQKTNPDLAKGLTSFANEEANESKEKMEGKKETVAKESAEWKTKHEARVKLLKDSAAALQQSYPDLARSLGEMTVAKHKTELQKMTKEKNEKEEAGEKIEPKSEQGETK